MDERRFNSEYEQVSDHLYTFLVRAVGDRDQTADILQDAAYRAFRARGQFRGDSTFKTWIYRIAVNVMKNQWSRAKRERNWFEEVQDLDVESSPTPEQFFTGKEGAMKLSQALMMLEEGYRIPFMLKHVDGLSYREISDVLGIAETAARVRVHRARNALQSMLKGSVT